MKFNKQAIIDAYENGDLDDELYALIDAKMADYTPSEVLAEWNFDDAMDWALKNYIENAEEAWLDYELAQRPEREADHAA